MQSAQVTRDFEYIELNFEAETNRNLLENPGIYNIYPCP